MRKKYFVLPAALCLSMMLFAGCGNNNATDNRTGMEATASPDDASNGFRDGAEDLGDGVGDAIDDVGEGAKDVLDGAGDAAEGAVNGTKRVIDGVTDQDGTDGNRNTDADTNNSVTNGQKN